MSRLSRSLGSLLLLLLLLSSLTACEKSAKENLREAGAAIAREDADKAEQQLQLVVKQDPSLKPEVDRQMARVHILRKEYDKAEQILLDLWKTQNLDQENLDTKQKQHKQLVLELLTELYRVWAESIDSKQNPAKFEEILRKGIERDAKEPRLNTMLVDFYFKHAEQLIQDGKKADAADTFEKVYFLRTSPQRRAESQSRASNLRIEVYNEDTAKRFETELKPKLVEAQRYDESKKHIIFPIEIEVDKRLRPGKEEDEQTALAQGSQSLDLAIYDFVRALHAMPADAPLAGRPEGVEVLDKKLDKGKFSLKASVALSDLIFYGRILKERAEKKDDKKEPAQTPPAEEKPADPAPAPAAPQGQGTP